MFSKSRKMIAATGVAVLASLGLGGAAIAQSNGSAPAKTPAAPAQSAPATETPGVESNAPEGSAADPDNVQYTAPGDPDYKAGTAGRTVTATPAAATTSGSGQGTATEPAGTEQNPAAEQGGGEQPGSEVAGNDGPGGHADEPGNPNADHQFQGHE
jgi:hypothetical protein